MLGCGIQEGNKYDHQSTDVHQLKLSRILFLKAI